MKRIDFSKLRESDIPLTTGVENNSGVMHVTRRDVCQAMLYVANGSVVDSTRRRGARTHQMQAARVTS